MKSLSILVVVLALQCYGIFAQNPSITTSIWRGGVRKTHESGELIFEDNFDTLDFNMWQHEITLAGGGNWEFQVYWNNRSNSYIKDSVLYLKPTLTEDRFGAEFIKSGKLDLWGGQPGDLCTNPSFYGCERMGSGPNIINPVASSRLRTVESFGFTYGKVEVRAKNPTGDWLWPAIWMLPISQEYGSWPASGEIDIMESRGNENYAKDGVQIGNQQYGSTLHYGIDYNINGWPKAHFEKNSNPGFHTDFHRYQVEWTPDYFKFSVDDEEIGTLTIPEGGFWQQGEFETTHPGTANPWEGRVKSAPFDKDFYILLNNACGGIAYFPDDAVNSPSPKPWSNTSPQAALDFYNHKDEWYSTWKDEESALQIDYVKVWAL